MRGFARFWGVLFARPRRAAQDFFPLRGRFRLLSSTIPGKRSIDDMDFDQPVPTDQELARRSRSGDRRAFHELVERHGRYLLGLAMRLVGQPADAEDVVQETFAGAYRGLAGFRQEASVKSWLTQILILQAARHHREASRRRGRLQAAQDAVGARQRQPAVRDSDLRLDLGSALLALNTDHREVIVLRELQGMSYDEIADVLKLPRGTVESRLFRARRQLQVLLREYLF